MHQEDVWLAHHLRIRKVKENEEEKKESITVEETLQAARRLFHVFWRSCPNWGEVVFTRGPSIVAALIDDRHIRY